MNTMNSRIDGLVSISPEDLVHLDAEVKAGLLRIDLLYARADNPLFQERIYKPDAKLYLHRDLAEIIQKAAKAAFKLGYRMILTDGLRTTTAQEKMLTTKRVQDNPHWLQEPRLLSPPGAGAHPRGMAVDVTLETLDGEMLDMGCELDYLATDSSPAHNPAHRSHPNLSDKVKANRAMLDDLLLAAAKKCSRELIPLPQEWWDYRFSADIYNQYKPLSDADLPPDMRLCD